MAESGGRKKGHLRPGRANKTVLPLPLFNSIRATMGSMVPAHVSGHSVFSLLMMQMLILGEIISSVRQVMSKNVVGTDHRILFSRDKG